MFPSYLESGEKVVTSYFEPDKHCCSYLDFERKKWIPGSQPVGARKKCFPAIWRPKNVVHNCQKQGKRL